MYSNWVQHVTYLSSHHMVFVFMNSVETPIWLKIVVLRCL
jgi:hypothetical protein